MTNIANEMEPAKIINQLLAPHRAPLAYVWFERNARH